MLYRPKSCTKIYNPFHVVKCSGYLARCVFKYIDENLPNSCGRSPRVDFHERYIRTHARSRPLLESFSSPHAEVVSSARQMSNGIFRGSYTVCESRVGKYSEGTAAEWRGYFFFRTPRCGRYIREEARGKEKAMLMRIPEGFALDGRNASRS